MLFSIIVPVYNRPDEVQELLESLEKQSLHNFEVLIVEDGAKYSCENVVLKFADTLNVRYFNIPNTDRSFRRNYGIENAKSDYFIFFDSDCVIPQEYFDNLTKELDANYSDCYGGPDTAHESFSVVQKAINYAMTSFFTTGGIRGGKKQMEKYKPRSFNMGFSRKVFDKVGGFNCMLSEDMDLAIRISKTDFRISLFRDVYVYHKRRISFSKFFHQVENFGVARVNMMLLHKSSLKIVHLFPTAFLLGLILIIVLSSICSPLWLVFPVFYTLLICVDALFKTKSFTTALVAIYASYIQIIAYGWGFLKSFFTKIILQKSFEDSHTLEKIYY
ncbi:MAG: glycosyltransferase [Paludibacter sp.]|nr:glycosyltransferase [Paludibacter sp.]